MARFYTPAGGQSSALNYVQTLGSKITVTESDSLPALIVSAEITTTGNPVEIFVNGDAENQNSGSWVRLKLFRDETEIGNVIWAESFAVSENVPYTLHFIDDIAAGTYIYSAKVVAIAGGEWNFGETDGPVITLVELATSSSGGGSADIADFVFNYDEEVTDSTMTIHNHDMVIQTTRDENQDADISITSADDMWITAHDEIEIISDTDDVTIITNGDLNSQRWRFNTDGTFIGPVEGNLVKVNGLWGQDDSPLSLLGPQSVVISGDGGEFLDNTDPENQIATVGYVDQAIPQELGTTDSPSFNKVYVTNNDGTGNNIKFGDDAWVGDVNQANMIAITGFQDPTVGGIIFGNGLTEKIASDENGNLQFFMDGTAYIGNVESGNRIATMSDVTGGSANIADFVFTYDDEETDSRMTIHNHDMVIQTTRDDNEDADISITSADDMWITANDTVEITSVTDEVRVITGNFGQHQWKFRPDGIISSDSNISGFEALDGNDVKGRLKFDPSNGQALIQAYENNNTATFTTDYWDTATWITVNPELSQLTLTNASSIISFMDNTGYIVDVLKISINGSDYGIYNGASTGDGAITFDIDGIIPGEEPLTVTEVRFQYAFSSKIDIDFDEGDLLIKTQGEMDINLDSAATLSLTGQDINVNANDAIHIITDGGVNSWQFGIDGKLYGPGEDDMLILGGGLQTQGLNMFIQSTDQAVVLNGQLGEFLGSSDAIGNQIATIGDLSGFITLSDPSEMYSEQVSDTTTSTRTMSGLYEGNNYDFNGGVNSGNAWYLAITEDTQWLADNNNLIVSGVITFADSTTVPFLNSSYGTASGGPGDETLYDVVSIFSTDVVNKTYANTYPLSISVVYSTGYETSTVVTIESDSNIAPVGALTLSSSGVAFINDPSVAANQIATIGDINSAIDKAYISLYSTADQGPYTANAIQPFTYNNIDFSNDISLAETSKITFAKAGKYNLAFSAQLHQTNGSGIVNIWLRKNGSNVPATNTKCSITANNPYYVAAWNLFIDAAVGDYFELVWSSDSNHTVIEYEAATGSGATEHPSIPSIILTVNEID